MDQHRNNPSQNGPNKPGRDGEKPNGNRWVALIIAVAIVLAVSGIYNSVRSSQYTQTTWSDFRAAMEAHQVVEAEIQYDRVIYLTREEAEKPASQQKACFTGLPTTYNQIELADELIAQGAIKVDREIVEDNSGIMMILSYAVMLGVAFLFMNMLTKRMSGDGMMGGLGKSKAKVYMEKQTGVTFRM